MRYFEKISYKQFKLDISSDLELYNSYELPKRSTKTSAGYDFTAINGFTLKPSEIITIPLGIKVRMNSDEFLMIVIRSSMGFKYNVRCVNQVGIVDNDYYNNPSNEGHIYLKIQNHGNTDYIVKKGDKICQGIFSKYLLVDNEEIVIEKRTSGLGSTNKEE